MQQVRSIIQYLVKGYSLRAICRELPLSRPAITTYATRLQGHAASLKDLQDLSDAELAAIVYEPVKPVSEDERKADFASRIAYFLKELKRTGVTRLLLCQEYRKEYPEGYSYTQFCVLLAAHRNIVKPSMRFDYKPTELYLRLSKLRYNAVPEQINCSSSRGITKEQLAAFCDGTFIDKTENIHITGATGCGKSYLACAIGKQACMLGYRTIYFSMNRFIEALAAARLDGSYIKLLNQISKTPLLVFDDFGLQPLTHDVRITLLQIL